MKLINRSGRFVLEVSLRRGREISMGYQTLREVLTDAAEQAHNLTRSPLVDQRDFFQLAGVLDSARAHADNLAARTEHPLPTDRDLAAARDLAHTLNSAHTTAGVLVARLDEAHAAHAPARGQARALAAALETGWARASFLADELDLMLGRARTPTRSPGARPSTASSARRLLRVAARLLPAGDRARYAEEFGSELADIALAGGRRRAQLAYAARQLRSAPRLRADLKSPRRRSAAP